MYTQSQINNVKWNEQLYSIKETVLSINQYTTHNINTNNIVRHSTMYKYSKTK